MNCLRKDSRSIALAVVALLGLGIVVSQGRDDESRDVFGVEKLLPTRSGGQEWFAHWTGKAGEFIDRDPDDPWFDTNHGHGEYTVDGKGKLTATGPIVRIYVHNPNDTEWSENLEITVYFTRRTETQLVSYSGPQIFARTNHGTIGDETKNLCDDRGYGAKVTVDGRWEFEKETAHHKPHGSASVASQAVARVAQEYVYWRQVHPAHHEPRYAGETGIVSRLDRWCERREVGKDD